MRNSEKRENEGESTETEEEKEERRGEERPTSAQAALTARVTLVALAGDYSAAARRDDPLLGAFSAPRALRNRVSILRLSERQ